MLAERYLTQTKAVDAAFLAQQTAMTTALTAAERAVATALLSAEKAVTKAESATEKRFEAVNEFRGQLTDQAATFMRRDEADTRIRALDDKYGIETKRIGDRLNELELRLGSRLDIIQGQARGKAGMTTETRADSMRSIAAIGALMTFISVAVAVILIFTR